jgi:CDP-diacylglycerol--glycerol-3-phosphate 3-phosphatidyltransferase
MTVFGRIIDPVVDKVMICAAFVLFASPHFWDGSRNISGVSAWMTVVILTRELLVSAVRAQAESGGEAFGALPVGKFKMAVQSVAVCVVLAQHGWNFESLDALRRVCVWAAVIVTAGSALVYIHRARRLLLTSAALAGDPTSPDAVTARDKEGAA